MLGCGAKVQRLKWGEDASCARGEPAMRAQSGDSPAFRRPPRRLQADALRIPRGKRAGALRVYAKLQKKKPPEGGFHFCNLAETVGFEPTIQV